MLHIEPFKTLKHADQTPKLLLPIAFMERIRDCCGSVVIRLKTVDFKAKRLQFSFVIKFVTPSKKKKKFTSAKLRGHMKSIRNKRHLEQSEGVGKYMRM